MSFSNPGPIVRGNPFVRAQGRMLPQPIGRANYPVPGQRSPGRMFPPGSVGTLGSYPRPGQRRMPAGQAVALLAQRLSQAR
jgi:hypothetical protein